MQEKKTNDDRLGKEEMGRDGLKGGQNLRVFYKSEAVSLPIK